MTTDTHDTGKRRKYDTSSALSQYNALDESTKCLASAILNLAATMFIGIQCAQNMNKTNDKHE